MPRVGMGRERGGEPGRVRAERLAPRVVESRELHRLVAPDRFDELRSGRVGALGDEAHERRGLERHAAVHERANDQQALARLQVESDPDGEIAVLTELRSIEIHRVHGAHGDRHDPR